jgi:phthiocerol/phenolphthiocerol synthesis type-I polyketide synthase E
VCVILEEPPLAAAYRQNNSRRHNLLLLSAKTKTALSAQAQRLKEYLAAGRDTSPDDLAYTSQIGRRGFPVRRFIVYENTDQLAATLGQTGNVYAAGNQLEKRKVVLGFTERKRYSERRWMNAPCCCSMRPASTSGRSSFLIRAGKSRLFYN